MKQPDTKDVQKTDVSFKVFILTAFCLIILQIVGAILLIISFKNWSDRASFGDMFGVVNTLFSGLAFAGVIYAILLQRRELELQRAELQMTREELRRSAEAQEKSEEALRDQAEMLLLTAKLNALNSILEAQKTKIDLESAKGPHISSLSSHVNVWEEYFQKLKDLMNEIGRNNTA